MLGQTKHFENHEYASSKNQILVPQAGKALDRLKYEVANQLGIEIPADGYWGQHTTFEVGKIGGNMVRELIAISQETILSSHLH